MALHEVYSGHISGYKAACKEHPELKSFDASIQQRTNKVVNSITNKVQTAQQEKESLSIHESQTEVYEYLLDVTKVVGDFIKDNKEDVWDNEGLRSLVKAYFENTTKTLQFFNTVQNVVNKAEEGQLIIQTAVEEFHKESAKTDENKKHKYEKTLEELKAFQDMKEDFDSHKFKTEFELVKNEQESLLAEVSKLKQQLDEEYSHIKTYKTVTNVVFGALFVCVAIIGVATLAFGGGAVLAAALGAGASFVLPAIALGWVATHISLRKLEDTLKKQQEIATRVDASLQLNKDAMVTIYLNLDELITKISSILQDTVFSVSDEQEHDIEKVMHVIKKKLEEFTEKIIEVGKNVTKFSKLIIAERYDILRMVRY